MNEAKCKYCGKKLSKAEQLYTEDMCSNCRIKLPLVRKLCKISQKILEIYGDKDDEKT